MYQLLDFGNGRKLERFGGLRVDRPCPAAEHSRPELSDWNADAHFELHSRHQGNWRFADPEWAPNGPKDWKLSTGFGGLRLFSTRFGHLGVFVEQQANWNWIRELGPDKLGRLRLLNLFAYTGGTTLAAAAVEAAVTHVDSARNMVRRARENATLSQLDTRPVRWIVEDARKFAEREARRGNRYDGVILDPPTYGHGTSSGVIWKIGEHLEPLLDTLVKIVPKCQLMLFTCHSSGFPVHRMQKLVTRRFQPACSPESGALDLTAADGRRLPSGNFVRWFSPQG